MPGALLQRLIDVSSRVRVKSVLNSLLWLSGISLSAIVALLIGNAPPTWLLVVLVAPIPVTMLHYIYFVITDPDRLQSEEYLIQRQSLELMEEKGDSFPIAPSSIAAIANPDRRIVAKKDEPELGQ